MAATPPASAPDAGPADPGTRYRAGDFVVYRYRGTFAPAPVVLREEVLAQDGNHLRIQVTAQRGAASRRWVQVLTDTPENQKNNVVDELWTEGDGGLVRLDNKGNADLIDLYSWTLPPCDGPPKPRDKAERSIEIASTRHECTCETASITCGGHGQRMETCECPDFLWTHASGSIRSTEDDSVLWQVEVVDAGRK